MSQRVLEYNDTKTELRAGGGRGEDSETRVRRFTVRATGPRSTSLSADEVLGTAGIPKRYERIGNLRVASLSVDFTDADAGLYYVEAELSSALAENSQGQNPVPIERRIPRWSWKSRVEEEVQERDAEDPTRLIRTAAGDPILVTRRRRIPILTISRLQYQFSPDIYGRYVDHANSKPFWGAPPRSAVLTDVTDDPEEVQIGQGQTEVLRRVTYTIEFSNRRDIKGQIIGWQHYLLHQGEHYLPEAGAPLSDRKKFKDLDRHPRVGNLASDGTALSDEDNAAGNYDWLKFAMFPLADLNDLLLGPF